MINLINFNPSPVNLFFNKCWVLVWFIILSISYRCQAQTHFAGSFRYFNSDDGYSVFLESNSRSLPDVKDSTYSITIVVKNIRNRSGVIRFKFYDDRTPFPHDEGFLRIIVPKSKVVNKEFTATYKGFKSGYIGIALHDDENGNKKLDFDWFIPLEGYAFSDYYHTSLLRPKYLSFRFQLKEDKLVIMAMRYHQ